MTTCASTTSRSRPLELGSGKVISARTRGRKAVLHLLCFDTSIVSVKIVRPALDGPLP